MNNYFFPEPNEIKTKINLVLYFTVLGYIISLFLKDAPVITNGLAGLIFILSFFSSSSDSLIQRFKKSRITVGFIIFYFFQLLSVVLSKNVQHGFDLLLLRLPLLIIPLSFCFIEFERRTWNKLVLFYAVATVIASILGFMFGVYKTIVENDTGNLYNDNISEIIGKQAVYFALYVAVAIMIFVLQLRNSSVIIQKYKSWVYVVIVWLLFILFMLASRTAMLTLLFLLVAYVLIISVQEKKTIQVFLFIFSIVIGVILVSKIFPKTLNKFRGATEINFQFENRNLENHFNEDYDAHKWNGTNTRLALWQCALEIWKKEPIIGIGLGDKDDELMEKYREKKFWYALGTNKHTHNQYVDVLMSMGLIGLSVFVFTFLILPIRLFLKHKNFLGIAVCILIALCFITENMLDRYQGLIFIPFIILLCEKMENKEEI